MTKEKEAALSGNRAMSQERQQLDKAQHGLVAAAMLSEQLDKKSSVISHMKQETSVTWSYCVDEFPNSEFSLFYLDCAF